MHGLPPGGRVMLMFGHREVNGGLPRDRPGLAPVRSCTRVISLDGSGGPAYNSACSPEAMPR